VPVGRGGFSGRKRRAGVRSWQSRYEMQIEARKKLDAVLTPEQRDQLRRYWSSR
jgi:Spy/CpxP family protein refolding chaperone